MKESSKWELQVQDRMSGDEIKHFRLINGRELKGFFCLCVLSALQFLFHFLFSSWLVVDSHCVTKGTYLSEVHTTGNYVV